LQKAPNSLDFANIYQNLGCVLENQNEWDESVRYYKMALAIRKQKAPNSLELARTYFRLGFVLRYKNQWDEARRFYELALAVVDCQAPQDPIRFEIGEMLKLMLTSIHIARAKLLDAVSTSMVAEPVKLPLEYVNLVTTNEELGRGYFGVVWKAHD
jgi:tetratricopeptide (TPR) repeat protein